MNKAIKTLAFTFALVACTGTMIKAMVRLSPRQMARKAQLKKEVKRELERNVGEMDEGGLEQWTKRTEELLGNLESIDPSFAHEYKKQLDSKMQGYRKEVLQREEVVQVAQREGARLREVAEQKAVEAAKEREEEIKKLKFVGEDPKKIYEDMRDTVVKLYGDVEKEKNNYFNYVSLVEEVEKKLGEAVQAGMTEVNETYIDKIIGDTKKHLVEAVMKKTTLAADRLIGNKKQIDKYIIKWINNNEKIGKTLTGLWGWRKPGMEYLSEELKELNEKFDYEIDKNVSILQIKDWVPKASKAVRDQLNSTIERLHVRVETLISNWNEYINKVHLENPLDSADENYPIEKQKVEDAIEKLYPPIISLEDKLFASFHGPIFYIKEEKVKQGEGFKDELKEEFDEVYK